MTPPGASKWNPIEHHLFSYISNNWAGKPLQSYETVLKYPDDKNLHRPQGQNLFG